MNLKPLYDRVVILPQKAQESTVHGFILPSDGDEKVCIGKVISMGEGQTFDGKKVDMMVKEGDNVLYSKFAGVSYKNENQNYLIIRQADILAVIEGE